MDNLRHHIIGTGRWGTWLARRLNSTGHEIISVRNRTESSAQRLSKELDVEWSPSSIISSALFKNGDIVWCCVPDAEITSLWDQLTSLSVQLDIVHCSGTSPVQNSISSGVFWPIQSITARTEPDWENLPIIVQANTAAFAKTLVQIASKVSGLSPKLVTSDKDRMRMHLGAVLTQNFSNFLWTLTEDVLAEAGLDYKDLLPLAKNHLEKLAGRSPNEIQTGPASRGDQITLDAHKALLNHHQEAIEIYTLLSEHIANKED